MRMSLKSVVIAAAVLGWVPGALAQTIKVGSKNFTEQFIVAELYAASLEAAGFKVERKINLGATLIAHEAIKAGAIDVYPEYTGTGLVAVMKIEASPEKDPQKVYQRVKMFYETNFNLTWLTPSRVDNGNAIVVRPETASQYGLKTLSDLGRAAGKLTLGGGSEFFDRYDGVPGLKAVYGVQFADARQFAALRLRYEALANKQVDVTNGFATDWQIPTGKFVALEDDKRLFPPYFLAPVVRMDIARNKEAVAALDRVSALLDNPTMQELNRQVEVDKKEPKRVAAEFLKARGVTH
jgi:osmoprotectant transport system substrate-binding protein